MIKVGKRYKIVGDEEYSGYLDNIRALTAKEIISDYVFIGTLHLTNDKTGVKGSFPVHYTKEGKFYLSDIEDSWDLVLDTNDEDYCLED